MEGGRRGLAGGGAGALLFAPHHHGLLHPGLLAFGTGGQAVYPAGLHQDIRDGGGKPAIGDTGAGGNGNIHHRPHLSRAGKSREPCADAGISAGADAGAASPLGSGGGGGRGAGAHLGALG